MIENRIKKIEEIEKFYQAASNIIIFGAGRMSKELILYLSVNAFNLKKISYILVSSKKNNPDNIQGIPVLSKQDIKEEMKKNILILIATFENISELIYYDFLQCGYYNIVRICDSLYEKLCWENLYHYNAHLSMNQYETALKEWYQNVTGFKLDLEKPMSYNEKIQWIKLHGITPIMVKLTDKYEVRRWVKNKIGEEYLIPLLGVWNNFEEIKIDMLPNEFALKCTHGCAWNEIVKDKKKWDSKAAKKKFDKWMKINYAFRGGLQLQYKDIIPRIIAEEYLENEDGDLFDYKFWCFEGKVEFIMFLSERNKGLRMNNYDNEWNLLPFTYNYSNSNKKIKRPEKLDEMIKLAEKLSEGFSHVRVDLYFLNDGTIKFGEMTFTSCNGICKWSNENINNYLGSLIKCCNM